MPVKLMKNTWRPQIHRANHSWMHGLETGVENQYTSVIIAHYDEGLGTPTDQETHPENANFIVKGEPNCFVNSRIDTIFTRITFSLTKGALETDGLHVINCMFMPVYMAFIDDYTAIDELSALEIQDVLEMTTESTDNQGYPLYNDIKMTEKFTNSALMGTPYPGLTTNQKLEGIAFNEINYYDMLHYMTNKGKLKATSGGIKNFTLTRHKPKRSFKIALRSKVKRMNKFTSFCIIVGVPSSGTQNQEHIETDTTNVPHVSVRFGSRFNEWNEHFNHRKV